MYQQSLVILKPDAVHRRLCGRIIQRLEDSGLKLHALKFQLATVEQSHRHYQEHVDKNFYPMLEKYFTSGPMVIMVIGGFGAISKIRRMVGATSAAEALPGTIRGDLAHQGNPEDPEQRQKQPLRNLIHASASPEQAEYEISIWFDSTEILDYQMLDDDLHGFE